VSAAPALKGNQVQKRTINTVIPALKDAGASDILEIPISKIIH
jgi:ATP phosphoribosyltransferase